MQKLPDILTTASGKPVRTPDEWQTRRGEILNLLSRGEYGFLPPRLPVSLKETGKNNMHWGGHGTEEQFELTVRGDKGEHCFPVTFMHDDSGIARPLFLYLSFEKQVYQKYFPVQEVLSRGFGVAIIHYASVTSDDGDMQNGLAGIFERPDDGTGYGKISLWAWAASRVLDALITRNEVDANNVAVIGHSRLGKSALWCGANDERIRFTCVNDSGCSGAALERGKNPDSETVKKIYARFPYWFCENYARYGDNVDAMPFDQHMALAACCPRFLAVTSASLDAWADPASERRGLEEAAKTWDALDVTGRTAYALRDGIHFLALEDWRFFMDFIDAHKART